MAIQMTLDSLNRSCISDYVKVICCPPCSRCRGRRRKALLPHCIHSRGRVSPAITSSHCSSLGTWHVYVLGLYGESCICSFPLQLSKVSEFSFVISSAELRPTLVFVLCVRALCSPSLLLPPAVLCVVGNDGERLAHPCRRSRDQHLPFVGSASRIVSTTSYPSSGMANWYIG